jgi:hypothetical protein
MFLVGAFDVSHAVSHHHAIGVALGLVIDGIDQIGRPLGVVGGISGGRLHPYGEKFGPEITGASLIESDLTLVVGIGVADIEAAIEKTLWRIGMGVDHDG